MKNYFNTEERTRHIILLCATTLSDDFAQSSALSKDEMRYLKKINEYLNKFNASVFERFGEPYKRKIINTMKCNDLRLVGKLEPHKHCISESATEDLKPQIDMLRWINCQNCDKCDYINCAVYAISVSCDLDGSNTSGCPYKIAENDIE